MSDILGLGNFSDIVCTDTIATLNDFSNNLKKTHLYVCQHSCCLGRSSSSGACRATH